jgi:hypothetical protein
MLLRIKTVLCQNIIICDLMTPVNNKKTKEGEKYEKQKLLNKIFL